MLLCDPLAVKLSGLLVAETARVWTFMVPLLMLATGAELSQWRAAQRWLALAAMWLLLAVLAQNLFAPWGQIMPLAVPNAG